MALTYVQGKAGETASSTTSQSVTLTSSVGAGNILLACGSSTGFSSIPLTSMSGGGVWINIKDQYPPALNFDGVSLWVCFQPTGGPTTVTFSISGTGTSIHIGLLVAEISGFTNSGILHAWSGGSTATSTTTVSAGNVAFSNGDLLYASVKIGASVAASVSATPGTLETHTAVINTFADQMLLASGTGTATPQFSWTGSAAASIVGVTILAKGNARTLGTTGAGT